MECYLCSNTSAIINFVDISSLYNNYITNSAVFTNRIHQFVSLHFLFYFIFSSLFRFFFFLYCVICILLHVLYHLLYLYVKWVSLYTKLFNTQMPVWTDNVCGLGCYVVGVAMFLAIWRAMCVGSCRVVPVVI